MAFVSIMREIWREWEELVLLSIWSPLHVREGPRIHRGEERLVQWPGTWQRPERFLFKSCGIYHPRDTKRGLSKKVFLNLNLFIYFNWRLITLQYCSDFCHTSTWISHGCTCVPHPELPSHLPPHPIPQGHPSAPALSILSHASNLDWRSISHMVIYMFQCSSLKSSHPRLLSQSPIVCSLHLCIFCCLEYNVIITNFLNSIYMC